jgi:cytidylate kinase
VTLEATLEEVKHRDRQDSTRAVSPLRQAEDAVLIDSSDRTVDDVVDQIVRAVRARWPA